VIAGMGQETKGWVSMAKLVLWFAIAGGVGVPLLFLAAWEILLKAFQGTDTIIAIMVWVEAFRVMFWPPSMFLVVNAPGNTAGELNYLLVLILLNVCIYALIGLAVASALRRRAAQIALGLFLIAAMFGVNVYWSEHLASFVIAAVVVALLFVAFFRRSPQQTAN